MGYEANRNNRIAIRDNIKQLILEMPEIKLKEYMNTGQSSILIDWWEDNG